MSTTFDIERMPAAAIRAFSHGGGGPTSTSVKTRAAQRGHRSGASMRAVTHESTESSPDDSGSRPGQGARSTSSEADASRAMPYTDRQSGRFEVISNSS